MVGASSNAFVGIGVGTFKGVGLFVTTGRVGLGVLAVVGGFVGFEVNGTRVGDDVVGSLVGKIMLRVGDDVIMEVALRVGEVVVATLGDEVAAVSGFVGFEVNGTRVGDDVVGSLVGKIMLRVGDDVIMEVALRVGEAVVATIGDEVATLVCT